MKQTTLLCALMFWLITNVNAAQDFERRVEKSFQVQKGGTLFLKSDRGSVEIRAHAAEEVKVDVMLETDTRHRERAKEWLDEFEITFEQRGSDVNIRGEWPHKWSWRGDRLKVHFDILVPEQYNLDVETAGGSIDVSDLEGEVKLHTSGGSVTTGRINGPVSARTSGGSISIDAAKGETVAHTSGGGITLGEIDGSADAKTSGGDITVEGVNGDLQARTSGGSLRLQNVSGNLVAKTSGGSITARLLKQITAPADLETSGGSIRLEVPPDFKADIDASTSGGRVYADLPITVRGVIDKSDLRGKLNGGGVLITLRTSGGNIEIRER